MVSLYRDTALAETLIKTNTCSILTAGTEARGTRDALNIFTIN